MNDLPADAPVMKDETSVFYLSTNDSHQKAQILKGLTRAFLSHLKSCFI